MLGKEHPKQEHDKKHNKECLEQELDVSLPTTTTKKKHKSKKHKLTKQKTYLVEAKATYLVI